MNEKRMRSLFIAWQERLGLTGWDIEVQVGGVEDPHSFMEIQKSTAYHDAKVFVQPWVLTGRLPVEVIDMALTDERIEKKIIHELLHLHTRDTSIIVRDDLDDLLHRDVLATIQASYGRAEERMVDDLAKVFYDRWCGE